MTISTNNSSQVSIGNGATLVWTYNFVLDSANEMQVIYTDANGIETLLAPSQYTLFLNPIASGSLHNIGGTVTYPKTGSPIADGTSLTFTRIVPLTQQTQVSNQGALLLDVIESALDELCLEIQQVSGKTGQFRGTWQTGIQYNFGDIVQDGINGTNTLNYYFNVIAGVSGVWATDLAAGDWSIGLNVQQVSDFATAAAASAAAALVSQNAAATSASQASTSATNAATSATSASTSAATATTQAAAASASATSASASQTASATSATNAAASAATATTQASNASTSATNASSSATSASSSATAAASSATAAAASAVLAGSTLTATSVTSNTIGTGNFTFTTQANKNFFAGQPIQAASAANGANFINGFVSSYSGTTLVITETNNGGSGAHSDWNISVSGTQGASGTGSGTVTSVSVTTANGVSGSVATATSTPAITLTLGAITPTSVAASSTISGTTLTSTVSTGTAPLTVSSTTQVANLNAATAGNATTATALATPRAIYGNNFDGTAALTQVIASTYGGTGNGFAKLSGPTTSEKTFTLPNASATILTDNAAVTVAQGGTGLGTLTLNNVILGNGTSTPQFVAPGTSGNVLTSNGTTWSSSAAAGGTQSVVYNGQSNSYTIVAGDLGKFVDFTGNSDAAFTLTAAATLGNGWYCYIRNAGNGGVLSLTPNGAENVDGINGYKMYYDEIRLIQCTGTAFNTMVLHGFNYRTYSSFTFTTPPGYKSFKGFLWGSGASGGKGNTNGGGGGGGGACLPFDITVAAIGTAGSNVTVTIGAGGASQSTANTAGNAGNSSTFGTFFTSFGGGRGGGSSGGAGGGGGGALGVGGNATTTTAGIGGIGYDQATGLALNTGGGAYGGMGGISSATTSCLYGGGGGAAAASGTGVTGGTAINGGGGGGGGGSTGGGPGGVSIYGGSGGAGATGSSSATQGTVPGGGGGGSVTGASGAGASGGIEIQGYV